jgi:two-component system cell cycle sensor histidine kinase/response regulator CckA
MVSRSGSSGEEKARSLCRSLIDAVNDVILIFDRKSLRILEANRRAAEVYGYPREELVGESLLTLTHMEPDPLAFRRKALDENIESIHFTRTGEKLYFLVSLSVIDYCGRSAVLSINRDIRERKLHEDALAASEKKLRLLLRNISEMVAVIGAEGRVRFIGPQVELVLGYPPAEVRERNIFDFIHPDDAERARAEYSETVLRPGEMPPSVLRLKSSAGEWVPFEIIANNQLQDPDVAGVIFTARDLRFRRDAQEAIHQANLGLDRTIDERTLELAKANAALRIENQQRRHTEKQLQESVSLLNATLESTADGILVVAGDGKVTSYNQKFVEMWRLPGLALSANSDEVLLAEAAPQLDDPRSFLDGVKTLYSHPESTSFDTLHLKDGRVFERYSQPQKVGNRIVGRVWSFRDVTEARRLEEELRHSQKMQAIGRLAGGVAHDFNNLLMLISGSAAQLVEEPELSDKSRELSRSILEATRRAGTLTRQLLAFSRKHPTEPQVVDLNRVVSEMGKMLQKLFEDRIRLDMKLGSRALPVYVDPSQLELVIMNLAINARDAMPEGGRVSIATFEEKLSRREAAMAAGVPAAYAVMEIRDTGHGMSPEVQARAFEPFFTTKKPGRGTGLGLSTVYGIVQQAGGLISLESAPDHGSTFKVYLPKASVSRREMQEKIAELPLPAGGHETVLLVEDEAGIRAMTRAYLESLGYHVLEAAIGTEAARISREHSGPIDLLLTDIIMPEMRGDDLVGIVKADRPEIRVLFMSGYADVPRVDKQVPIVEKPFEFPELGRQVRAVLDRPGGRVSKVG